MNLAHAHAEPITAPCSRQCNISMASDLKTNLRHLRVFLSVAENGSITRAGDLCHISQPAATQVVAKLERAAGQPLFLRRPQGLFPTPAGDALAARVRRALAYLDPPLDALAPRLRHTASHSQLQALVAMCEAENFTLAARQMGLAQPTVHRAISQLEQIVGRTLFERTAHGMLPSRATLALAHGARLAFAELELAEADLAELLGREVGRIVVGAMPLSRSCMLPQAIASFRVSHPDLPIQVVEGPYRDLLADLRRGAIDLLIGALRDPAPIDDVEQHALFADSLVLVARPDHPLAGRRSIKVSDLARHPFVVPFSGTPTRLAFDRLFAGSALRPSLIETASMVLMRELLRISDHVGCISGAQVAAEIELGVLVKLPFAMKGTLRSIGLTQRSDWVPTTLQQEFMAELRAASMDIARD